MLRWAVPLVLAICFGCSGQKKLDPLVGAYVGWMFLDGQAYANDGSMGTDQKLTLEPSGRYRLTMESSVMMTLSAKAEGTYVRTGDEVNFTGTMTTTVDDGYKKGTDTSPHQMRLKIENGMLVEKDGKGDLSYFRKEGAGPPPLPPQLQLKESEPKALALIKRVEEAYASLATVKVTGRVQSQGGGFVAKDARFKVLFQRPSKFRFEASVFVGGKEVDRTEITWDGGARCWWYSTEFGENKERTLGNALSIAAVNCGPEADILPSLLLFNDGALSQYPEATLLPDEKIGTHECQVLQLRSRGADATKLWVEKSSGMILRLYEQLRAVTVTFDPHPNAAIDSKELLLGQRSKPVVPSVRVRGA